MIHLRLRTEFSFRKAYGQLGQVMSVLKEQDVSTAAITDNGTWGHAPWERACRKQGIKPIFGAEIMVVNDATLRDKVRQHGPRMAFLARNVAGLQEIYRLVTLSNGDLFYFWPRIDYSHLDDISDNVIVLSGSGADLKRFPKRHNFWVELNPLNHAWNKMALAYERPVVACISNTYPTTDDRGAYEILTGRDKYNRTVSPHIMSEAELRVAMPYAPDSAFDATYDVAGACEHFELPRASMVEPDRPKTLRAMCQDGGKKLGVDLADPVYEARLDRELGMIESKNFEDYFYVIADMVAYAKKHMLVGPARGSSAGSLVCYLLGITDVDPLVHDLMFERFIDVTREDLPDIDIDFQDDRRDMVVKYLQRKYGEERVGRIGTVNRYKAKSCISEVAGALNIPPWEVKDVKGAIIERSTGDARAQFCIQDTLDSLEIGKALVAKYPAIRIAARLEGHARHSGMHAAGVIVTQEPITNYCSIDRSGSAQLDKYDAEYLNLLKIDVLGLRTLSIIQDTLDQIGKDRQWLIDQPLSDKDAFEILNEERYSGVFQFEGYALQSLTRQMKVHEFNDIVAITTLARPGPLHSGGATEYIARHTGQKEVQALHPLVADLVSDSAGVVIYQEQVMSVGRKMGKLSWEDVSMLRKAMSKSLGEEFFNKYWEKFLAGALEQGVTEKDADHVWKHICTFGSWAFNKSHAISYGMVSYWCALLKAHYPLEFAAATMRNVKSDDQGVKVLRDLVKEGHEYIPVDRKLSDVNWSVKDGRLVGGLTNVKGIGPKTASKLVQLRGAGKPLTPGMARLLVAPTTPYDDIFPIERRFGDYYVNPEKYKILSGGVTYIKDIGDPGEYVFLAILKEKNLRDLNEYGNVVKRGGRLVKQNNLFLNMVLEDDTGPIIAKVERYSYQQWGKPIVESGRIGDIYLFKGHIKNDGWRLLFVDKWRKLT